MEESIQNSGAVFIQSNCVVSKILADEITMLVTQSDCEACREWYLLNLMGKASFYLFSICCFDLEIDMNINLPKGNNISMPLMHSSYKIWD